MGCDALVGRSEELLTQHDIAWEEPTTPEPVPAPTASAAAPSHFTADDKIALFRRLFLGRDDVYAQRWESANGTSGYSPVCGNQWKPDICHKPRVKCGDPNQRQLLEESQVSSTIPGFQGASSGRLNP